MRQSWKNLRYRLEHLGLTLLADFIPRLSRRTCARLARGAGWLAWHIDRRGRAVALANLEAAFGDRYDDAGRRRIALGSYRNFVRAMIDLFWAPNLSAENLSRHVEVENLEAFMRPFRRGAPAPIVLSPHFGTFEWGHLAIALLGGEGTLVAENFKNPLLTGVFDRLRSSGGSQVVRQELSMIRLLKNVKRGSPSGLLPDLTMPLSQAGVILDAFGLNLRATILHAVIVHRTGAPIAMYFAHPRPDGTCLLRLHAPLEIPAGASVPEIAQGVWDFIEPKIAENPELWMWSYKHWRFRPSTGGERYPFYANPSKQFDRELRDQTKSE